MEERKKMTLFELLKYKKEQQENEKEIECPVANPLDLKFTSLINIKSFKYNNCDFKLEAIEEYKRTANDSFFTFTDYVLFDRRGNADVEQIEQSKVKLRFVDHDALVLYCYESMPYNEELDIVLKGTERTCKFEITDDDDVTIAFGRINNLKCHWDAEVKKLVSVNHNGKFTRSDPVHTAQIKYWDFWRDTDGDTEMLFVEMDENTGWIKMWRGGFIDLENIIIL